MQGPHTLFPDTLISVPPSVPASTPAPAPASNLRELAGAVYRQAWLVLACTLGVTLLALWLYAQQPRVYTSTAKVWVQTEQQGSPSFLSGIAAYRETPYPDPVNRKIETEIELMLTRTNAQSVVERLSIQDAQLARGSFSKLRAMFGGSSEPADGSVGPVSRARTVDLFLDGISIEPLRSKTADTTSNVLEVRFECTDPALAPRALQAFLDNYLQLGAQQNRRLGETTSRLIESKLAQAKEDLRQSEDQIVALLVKDGSRAATASPGSAAALAPVAPAPLAMRGGLRLDTEPDPTLSGSPAQVVAALKTQTLDLQARLDEARQSFTDDADNVRNLRARLDAARQRLVSTVRENTQVESQLGRLERQRALAQERFVELQRKLDQIDLYLRLNPTETESRVVIDAPYKPAPNEGRKRPIVAAVGPLAGLLLGLFLAGVRELGGDRLRSARDVQRALGVPVLGGLPTLPAASRQALLGPAFAAPAPGSRGLE